MCFVDETCNLFLIQVVLSHFKTEANYPILLFSIYIPDVEKILVRANISKDS